MSNLGNTGSPRSRQVHSQNADERETPEEATLGSKGIRPPAKPSASDRRGPGKDRGDPAWRARLPSTNETTTLSSPVIRPLFQP
jgi:hypothetical protein